MAVVPRRYQLEVLERARRENIIIYLGTGTGKTLIAIMLIQSVQEKLSIPGEKRIAVFLAPTVSLVIQQARAITTATTLKVGEYYGDKGVDTWSIKQWQEEVDAHQILVMTPQVFLNALGTSALKLDFVEILVMDECHHAHKNHPYALIMKTHYHVSSLKSKPKIFGMTASPVIQKGVSSKSDCVRKLKELESVLDAKVYTLEDKSEVEEYYPSPKHYVEYYERPERDYRDIKSGLINLKSRIRREAVENATSMNHEIKIEKSFDNLEKSIYFCLCDLGLLPAQLAVEILLTRNRSTAHLKWKPHVSLEEEHAKASLKEQFLRQVSEILKSSPPVLYSTIDDMPSGTVSPKVLVLLNLLTRLRGITDMRCIVFVERVIVAIALAKLISQLPFLSHLHCDYMSGLHDKDSRKPAQQQKVLEDFASGKLNLLIATSVAEEGIDVQACCAVVRFDVCQTLRSHVQSRGRARNRESSTYAWLLERGNVEQQNLLETLRESENVVEGQVLSRNNSDIPRDAPPEGDLEFFRVESGACKSTQDSVSFIHQYCARLGDRYYNAKPKFSFRDSFICIIEFPPNAPLHSVQGPLRRTEELAKKAACLQACQQLYEMGEVRPDTLCPDVDDFDVEEKSMQKNESGKQREMFPAAKPAVFEGNWLSDNPVVQLEFYKINFAIDPPESTSYSKFALLLKGVIDDEVVTLFSQDGVVKAELCHVGSIQLGDAQIKAAKSYQELLLNISFNRLSRCWDHPEEIVWDKDQAFLLLPLIDRDDAVDWGSVFRTAEVHSTLRSRMSSTSTAEVDDGSGNRTAAADTVRFADGNVHSSAVQDMVVVTVHNGRLYRIWGIFENLTAESMLPDRNFTYIDYYKDKYARTIRFPGQSLLKAKQMRGFQNLLIRQDKRDVPEGSRSSSFVELPPELCIPLAITSGLLQSLHIVPSFIHRITSLACAKQLKSRPNWPGIPTAKVLEAITSKKCHEGFSYESLELLGDSFLKYVVTQRLFLVYDKKHEGQLSARRSRATCNATLYRLAKSSGIAEYIRDEQFNPSNWIGPGMVASNQGSDDAGIRRKTLADVVEALIGAYLVTSGAEAAEIFMKLIGIDIDFEKALLDSARKSSLSIDSLQHFEAIVATLELKLQYTFQNKSLLVEAITHPSASKCILCYQRLEFLGDGVLDFLVSKHLFDAHPGLSPGELTDLRSAAVNNNWFARLVVKNGLHPYLQHDSEDLGSDIREFVQHVANKPDASCFEDLKAPKVLGDLLESIAGAVFVDTNFDLDKLWEVMLPLLAPIVTPETLRFHPVRRLMEVCTARGMAATFRAAEDPATIALTVSIGERLLVETSCERPKKVARIDVAQKMLAVLAV